MGLLQKLLGPQSKYDETLPYTYEARVRVFEDSDDFKTYFSDTICGLVAALQKDGIGPEESELFEIYHDNETQLAASLLTNAEGKWLSREELCHAFEQHYPGHIHRDSCSFEDRSRSCAGP